MAIEEIKRFWDDLRSGSEYQTEGLNDDPNAPRNDHWFKDYALPVGLNALMSPFQGIKDMYVDTPVDVLKGHPLEAMEEFWYPMMGALEGYEDQYHFPFNPSSSYSAPEVRSSHKYLRFSSPISNKPSPRFQHLAHLRNHLLA